jgi:hypothetical protein
MTQTLPHQLQQARSAHALNILVPILYISFALAMALFSTGFLEADEITHFLYARAIWHDPYALVSIWGRMGCSALFGLAATHGILAARLLAVGVTLLTAHGTATLLRYFTHDASANSPAWLRRHATALAWVLFFAQPCVLLNSFTVMTEMLLACCWVWAAVVAARFDSRRGLLLAGFVLGIGGIMRPEGWLAIAAWPLWAAAYRASGSKNLRPEIPTVLASTFLAGAWPLAWYLIGAHVWKRWDWVIAAWPWAARSPYGKTAGLFVLSSLAALAFWMWVPVVAAGRSLWKSRSRQGLALLVAPALAFFLAHGILGSAGLFGSLSLPRYFQAIAPMIAVLAAMGLGRFSPDGPLPNILRRITPLCLLPLLALAALRLLPMQAVTEQQRLDVIIAAVQARHPSPDQLLIRHPYPLLRLNLDLNSPAQTRIFHDDQIAAAPPGTLLIMDSTVWDYENCPRPEKLIQWGYVADEESARKVDAIPQRFEPLSFQRATDLRVRLWVKQR